jgi:hypothetical protein
MGVLLRRHPFFVGDFVMAKFMPKMKGPKAVPKSKKMPTEPRKMPMAPGFSNGPEMKMDRAAHKIMGPGYKHTGGTTGSNG